MLTKVQKFNNFDILMPLRPARVVNPENRSLIEHTQEAEAQVSEQPEKKAQPNQSNVIRMIKGLVKVVLYLVFVGLAVFYTPKILAKTLNTQYPLATITSGSMWPELKTNDLVLMKGATAADVQVGQIIIFRNSGGFTIHRLIRIENGKFVTKGDANSVEDKPINENAVIGRVVSLGKNPFRIPFIGVIAKNLGPKINHLESTSL